MKKSINAVLGVLFIIVFSFSTAQAQTKFVNEFLNIGVGARAHGMFGSVVADVSDVTAAYWNPAGLSLIDKPFSVSAMHAEWFGSVANYDYIGFAKKLDQETNSYGALTLIRLGIDNIPNTLSLIGPDGSIDFDRVTSFSAADYAMILSYSRNLNKSGLSIGGNTKIIRRVIGEFGNAWGFGFDMGLMWTKSRYSIGIVARDITTTFNAWSFNISEEDKIVLEQTGNDIPVNSTELVLPRLIIGFALKGGSSNLSYTIQANLNLSSDGTEAGIFSSNRINLDPTMGFEIAYNKKVFIRAGVGNIQRIINEASSIDKSLSLQPNIGLGLYLGRLNIDYALTNIGEISGVLTSHIISLNLSFLERPIANVPSTAF